MSVFTTKTASERSLLVKSETLRLGLGTFRLIWAAEPDAAGR